jgi:hypothetical protein
MNTVTSNPMASVHSGYVSPIVGGSRPPSGLLLPPPPPKKIFFFMLQGWKNKESEDSVFYSFSGERTDTNTFASFHAGSKHESGITRLLCVLPKLQN